MLRKTRLFFALLASTFTVTGCGGDGGGSEVILGPTIANMTYSPLSASATLGTISLSGNVDVTTARDLMQVRITDSRGGDRTVPVAGAAGFRFGRLSLPAATIAGSPAGMFTFTLWLVDVAGQASNRLTGSVEIRPVASTANAGDDYSAPAGSMVALDGRSSTNVNGLPTKYRWAIANRSPGAQGTLTRADSPTPTFEAISGVHQIQLIINDGFSDSAPAFTKVSALPAGTFSRGSTEADVTAVQGSPLQLNGSLLAYDSIGLTRVFLSSSGGKVVGWRNYNGTLRVSLPTGWQDTGATGISTAATIDDVIRLQGVPVSYDETSAVINLGYDKSGLTNIAITKDTGRVTSWRDYNGVLVLK